ncbi:MAG: ABC transporter substrate-binding protein [Planctomycetota bacterium]
MMLCSNTFDRLSRVLVAVLSGALMLSTQGCEPASARADSKTDATTEPLRVVSLDGTAIEWLIAMDTPPAMRIPMPLGAPESWSGIPEVSFTHSGGVDREQVLVAGPDLIVVSPITERFAAGLDEFTGASLLSVKVRSVDDAANAAMELGTAIGQDEAGRELAQQIRHQAEAPPLAPADDPMQVLALFGSPNGFFVMRPDTYLGDLLARMNVKLVGAEGPEHSIYKGFVPLDLESAVQTDPDAILVIAHGPASSNRPTLGDHPAWSELRAVQDGRVAGVGDFLLTFAPGARVGEAVEMLRSALSFNDDGLAAAP